MTFPHDESAEREVLASSFAGAAEEVCDAADASWFATARNGLIFAAIQYCVRTDMAVDIVTVANALRALGTFEQAGGAATIADVAARSGWTSNVGSYLAILRRHAIARATLSAANAIAGAGNDESLDADEIIERAETALLAATREHTNTGLVSVRDAVMSYVERMEAARLAEDGVTGIRCGLSALDSHVGGFQPGWLVEVLAPSKMGKTAFALGNIAVPAAQAGHSVAVFSLEMPSEQLAGRMIASLSGVPSHLHRTNLGVDDFSRFAFGCQEVDKLPISIMDPANLTPNKLRMKARRALMGHPHPLIVVDYLQLMGSDNPRDNRTDSLEKAAQGCKNLAQELGATVVLLVQPTSTSERDVRQTKGHRISRADVRGGQAIFAAADVVLIPFRHHVVNEAASKSEADITLDACRHAEEGARYPAKWNGARMRFDDPAFSAPRGMAV